MSSYFLIAAGVIFCLLGFLHAIYTLADMRRPRRLAPTDPDLVTRMRASGVRLSGDRTNMWDAWLGFNLSHSLGAMLFGALCIMSVRVGATKPLLACLIVISAIYLVLSMRFWFYVPATGIAIATACLLVAWAT